MTPRTRRLRLVQLFPQVLPVDAALGWGVGRSRRLEHELLPDADTPSYRAVINSDDGWGAVVSSSKPLVEPSTEYLPVTSAPLSPPLGEIVWVDRGVCTPEGLPVGSSTPPVVDVLTPTESPSEIEEETGAEPTQAVNRRATPTVGPAGAKSDSGAPGAGTGLRRSPHQHHGRNGDSDLLGGD